MLNMIPFRRIKAGTRWVTCSIKGCGWEDERHHATLAFAKAAGTEHAEQFHPDRWEFRIRKIKWGPYASPLVPVNRRRT